MKLGDLIREYRESHALSQRQFAIACELSNGYISILERGVNPGTGKPVTPTIPQLKKLASGMGMTLMDMLDKIDDMPIDISGTVPTDYSNTPNLNTVRVAARNGSYQEWHLTDEQIKDLVAQLDQLGEFPDDL